MKDINPEVIEKLGLEEIDINPEDFLAEDNYNDTNNQAVISKYINYNINNEAKTFGELFKRKYIPYVNDNYKFNSCFINVIINDYKLNFDKLDKHGVRLYKELTYERLFKLLDIEDNKHDNIGLSIDRAIDKFYSFYKIGLNIIDPEGILIFEYIPKNKDFKENFNKKIYPRIHKLILTSENHIESLNNNLINFNKNNELIPITYKLIDNKELQKMYDDKFNLKVSSYFNLPKDTSKLKEDKIIHYMFDNLLELKNYIQTINIQYLAASKLIDLINNEEDNDCCDQKFKIFIKAIFNGSLDDLLYDLFFIEKIKPQVYFCSGKIRNINIMFCKHFIINITRADIIQANDTEVCIDDLDTYEKYYNATNEYLLNILNINTISEYHPSVIDINNYYKKIPINGHFPNVNFEYKYNAIDINKCYTSILKNINKIPKFDYFDIYKDYDNHEIEEFNEYIIEINEEQPYLMDKNILCIICPEKYTRLYGIKLNIINELNIKYKIIYYRRPSNIEEVNYKDIINDLYNKKFNDNDDIDKYIKKYIINCSTGLLEKKYNTKTNSHIFKNYKKALHYSKLFGGQIYTIIKTKFIKQNKTNDLDFDLIQEDNEDIIKGVSDEVLFIVKIQKEKELTNGFRPIKDLIYDYSHIEILKIYNKLKLFDFKPVGIKTDCILYQNNPLINIQDIFEFNNKIGGYKLEKNKFITKSPLLFFNNKLCDIFDYKPTLHNIKDEYNLDEFKYIINNTKRLCITGFVAGVGKSFAIKNSNKKTLFILPWNEQCLNLIEQGYDAITINMLLGIDIDDKINKNNNRYDITGYEVLCFDEIFLYSSDKLKLIDKYIRQYPELIITATGDSDQNEPFDYIPNNIKDIDIYLNDCINIMFKDQIYLKINKRCKTEEDKQKIYQLKEDIFNPNLKLIDIFKKYNFNLIYEDNDNVNKYNNVKTIKNICYFNKRSSEVDKYVHNNLITIPNNYILINNIKYWKGMILICREHFISKRKQNEIKKDYIDDKEGYKYLHNFRLYKNYNYIIDDIKDNKILLKEPVKKIKFYININQINYFKLPYSKTGHSLQGSTINDKITIFDTNTPYVNRKWIWTAITRASDLNNINIFIHSDNEIKNLTIRRLNQYFKLKIDGYISQDKKTNKYNPDNYINLEWFKEVIENIDNDTPFYCSKCHNKYELYLDYNNNVHSNISAERIDCSKGHNLDNIKLWCVDCNKKRSNNKY